MKLSREQSKARAAAIAAAGEAHAALETAVTAYNEAIAAAWSSLETARDAYNEAIEHAGDAVREIGDGVREAIGERSERWQESDAGVAASEWCDGFDVALDSFDPTEPEPAELPEHPGETIAEATAVVES